MYYKAPKWTRFEMFQHAQNWNKAKKLYLKYFKSADSWEVSQLS